MNRVIFALAVAVFTIATTGCSSSSSSDSGGQDMSQMAAALDQQAPAATPAAATTTNAPLAAAATPPTPTTTPAPQAAAPAPTATAPADPSLRTKRGFGLKDWSNEATYVLVKSDAAKTTEALARAWNGKVVKDVLGKPYSQTLDQVVVFQLAGHPWSIFACDGSQIEPLSTTLSSNADVMFIWNSDFNGWSGVDLYRAGQEVEAVHWGPDGDNLGEDADASKWHSRGLIAKSIDGEGYNDLFLFRSKARNVNEADLQKGEAFVDAFLRQHDAYLPDADQMPWGELEDSSTISSPLPPAAFAGVHAVELPE